MAMDTEFVNGRSISGVRIVDMGILMLCWFLLIGSLLSFIPGLSRYRLGDAILPGHVLHA